MYRFALTTCLLLLLSPLAYPASYEAEKLAYIASAADKSKPRVDCATEGAYVAIRGGPGDAVSFTLPVPEAGTYYLAIGIRTAPDSGRFSVQLNDKHLKGIVDCYGKTEQAFEYDLGKVTLPAAGRQILTLACVGKQLLSSGHTALVDYVKLIPLDVDLASYRRKEFQYEFPKLGAKPVRILFKLPTDQGQARRIVYYLRNLNTQRLGQESDEAILRDLIFEQGFVVMECDFQKHPLALSPNLDWDLERFQRDRKRNLEGSGCSCFDRVLNYVLPEGYRIQIDARYWNMAESGALGTKERVLATYNKKMVAQFPYLAPVKTPDQMVDPYGDPIDYGLGMDIIYPSQATRSVPVVFWAGTEGATHNHINIRNTMKEDRPHFVGFLMRGYAFVHLSHNWNPVAKYTGYFDGDYSMDDWNGLKSSTAAIRYLRAHAKEFNLDERNIGGLGHSKGSFTVALLSDPQHETRGREWCDRFDGFPQGTYGPQPNPGFSSRIKVGYQSMGNGTRRHAKMVTPDYVPTVIACGELDPYGHWKSSWPESKRVFQANPIDCLILGMTGLGHCLPMGHDPRLNVDRYEAMLSFFDRYLKE